MKRWKQAIALCLTVALLSLPLAGCGGGSGSGSTGSTPQTSAPAADESQPGGAESGSSLGLDSPIVISYSHVQSTASPTHQAMEWLGNWLVAESDGMVSLEIFPAGQLYNDSTEIDACVGGNIDMISTYMSKLTSIDTDTQFCLAPFLFDDPEQMEAFYTSEYAQPLYAKLNSLGLQMVDVQFGGSQFFWSSKEPLTSPEKFQGIKLREGGGAMSEALYNALGASLTIVAYNDLYTAMQTKLVDACVISVDAGVPIQLQETVTSVVAYGHQYAPYLMMFNKNTWQSYSPEVQALLTEGLALAREKQLEIANTALEEGLKEIEAVCEFYEADAAAVAALKEIWDPITAEFVSSEWMDAIAAFKAAS